MNIMYKSVNFRRFPGVTLLAARSNSFLLLVVIAVCALAVEACGAAAPEDTLALGRKYTSWFYAGETDRLWQLFSPQMKTLFGNVDGLKTFRATVIRDWGHETKVLKEHTQPVGIGTAVYQRIGSFSAAPSPVRIEWGVESDGTVTGLFVRLASEKVPAGVLADQPKEPPGHP
jgi:hypothetical protein